MGHPMAGELNRVLHTWSFSLVEKKMQQTLKEKGSRGGRPWACLGRLREGFLEEGSPEDCLGMSWAKRRRPNGPGGRAAGAKGLKPGDKVSPMQWRTAGREGAEAGWVRKARDSHFIPTAMRSHRRL